MNFELIACPCRRKPLALMLAALALLPLAAHAETELAPVTVTATGGLAATAEAGAGFRADSAEVGPLGSRPLLDTPYSINVVSSELIDNTQASSLTDLLKYLPSAQMEARGGLDVGRPQTRGMESSVVANNHLDGFNIAGTTAYPMELFERLEVINSLTGALYGPASPAGNFNYVSKRPTDTPLRRLTLGYGSAGQGRVHADLADRLGESRAIGYRVNLLHEEGEGYVKNSELRRDLVGLAFDVHFSQDTVLEVNASHYEFEKLGYPGGFSYSATRQLPDAPDPTQAGYGQPDAGLDLKTDTASLRLKHRFNDDWRLTAGFSRQIVERGFRYPTHALTSDSGDYRTTATSSAPGRFTINSNQITLNGRVGSAYGVHDLVIGSTGFDWDVFAARNSRSHVLGTARIGNPQTYGRVDWLLDGGRYQSMSASQQSLILGDTWTLNERWSALLVASYSWLRARNYNQAGERTDTPYDKEGVSPTLALMYKPRPNLTTYVAYADSLQQGDTAPTTGVANPGQALAPFRSEQWEAGVKIKAGGIDAGAALFRIERPFAYADASDNIFREQGLQVNKGLELTAAGQVLDHLAVYGGVTFLDPRLTDTVRASTSGKQVVGAPRVQANLLAEYGVPGVSGLVLSGNLHHTGKRAANDTNSVWVDAYTTVDLGARYTSRLLGRTAVWRLTVNNIANTRYWASIFPGNINGTDGSANAFLGTPREIRASISFDL